jgi:hypothetical protein
MVAATILPFTTVAEGSAGSNSMLPSNSVNLPCTLVNRCLTEKPMLVCYLSGIQVEAPTGCAGTANATINATAGTAPKTDKTLAIARPPIIIAVFMQRYTPASRAWLPPDANYFRAVFRMETTTLSAAASSAPRPTLWFLR